MIVFDENSNIVKDYVLLIKVGEKTIEDIPEYSNLRKVVADVLEQSN